jgi:hypothetical protein
MTSTIVARGSNRSQRPERTGKRYDEAAGDLRHEQPEQRQNREAVDEAGGEAQQRRNDRRRPRSA